MSIRVFVGYLVLVAMVVDLRATEPEASSTSHITAPDFQRHIVPLLGTLGCNGRACHGSFQGRGGLRLSLFGYDFEMDYKALTGEASSVETTRVNRKRPDHSLILQKPLLRVDHEGGQRFEEDSWQHQLLKSWIASGAQGVDEAGKLDRLDVTPKEITFSANAKPVSLRVVAVWKDGVREDVTRLCRFRSNNDSVVTVRGHGVLESHGPGDTHVVAFYDNGVVAIPVTRAVFPRRAPDPSIQHPIDQFIDAKLAKLGLMASPRCTDTEFLRRISIDVTGSLPTPDAVVAFERDGSPDKREEKIRDLLATPEHAAWWANKLCDITGCNPRQQAELGQELAMQWYEWIRRRVEQNVPYDELVEGMMLATGRPPGQSYEAYAEEFSSYFRDEAPADFAARTTLPHYWSRRSIQEPSEKALAVAHSFLGIRIQCAQCHKHPWAQWTQEDFTQFSSFFDNVAFGVTAEDVDQYKEMAKHAGLNVRGDQGSAVRHDVLVQAQEGKTIPWREVYVAARKDPVELSLLRDEQVSLQASDDPRVPIMRWMRSPRNPWFARALVNRVWASYFHRGLVEPTDDLSPANPPSNPRLLEWLEKNFIAQGYDLRWLHFQILSSATYQRSWRPNETNRGDQRNYSRAIPRRVAAEVVYDALKQATAAGSALREVRRNLSRRASGHLSMKLAGTYAMNVFGKPERGLNCDCERVNDPTLLQAVFIQNDPLVRSRIAGSGWVAEIREAGSGDVDRLVEEAYLRTVSRRPTPSERKRTRDYVEASTSTADGIKSLLWALVNTKEFILQH